MKKLLVIIGLLCIIVIAAYSRPNNQATCSVDQSPFTIIADQPPFGISLYKDSSGEYLVFRTKRGYGEALSVLKLK